MSSKLKATVAPAALAYALLACAPASANIVIGAPGTGQNFIPFGSIARLPEYQQVYAASDFTGTVKLDDIEFFTVAGSTETPNPGVNPGVIKISLSTTSAAVNGLSTNLSANLSIAN